MTTGAISPTGHGGEPSHGTPSTQALRDELLQARLAGRRRGGATQALPRADREVPLPLSFGQQQMWFLNRLAPESPEYLMPLALRLRGGLDRAALRGAISDVVGRHEVLRTRYRLADDRPVQIIDPPRPLDPAVYQEVDLTGTAAAEREIAAAAFVDREISVGIDLELMAPLRIRLVRLADDDHLLLVVFHHIAGDDRSTEVFIGELTRFYRHRTGGDGELPAPLNIQYADYAAWQRARTTAELLAPGLAYWRGQLAGVEPLELPTDRPRPAVRDWHGATAPLTVPADRAAVLRELAQERETTPFVLLLTAFQTLLARYTGRADIAVGTPVADRTRPEVRDLIGYLVNTVVLRARWEGDPTFDELLRGNRATVLDALSHQDVPFSTLVDELQPERDLSRTPLFQVAFALHPASNPAAALHGVGVERADTPWTVAKFDLSLQLEEQADGSLRGAFEYATALFDPETAERLAEHFTRLLDGIADAPGSTISELPLIGEAEETLLRSGAGDPRAAAGTAADRADEDLCVQELFARRAAATPDAVAVTFQDTSLTYRELDQEANRIAHALRSRGAAAGGLVGVCLGRGPSLVATLLGVLRSGAAYLPLDPSHPAERLATVLAEAEATVVVSDTGHIDRLSAAEHVEAMLLDSAPVRAALASAPTTAPRTRVAPDDPVYVIYTSGSTGRPKGVVLTHRNVVRLFTASRRHFGFGPDDVWTLFHSYAFDFSVWELYGALLHGGRLVVVPVEVSRSPDDFLSLLVDERVTVLNQTPSAFRSLVDAARRGDPRLDRLALRTVIFGGEKLDVAELAPWFERMGPDGPELINMYGITETTVHVTHHRVEAAEATEGPTGAIGRPLDDLRAYVLDPYGRLAPVGVPGEIHVGGAGLARGYLGRPDLTAERFVPDPFSGNPGARLYRTGDLAKAGPDGRLTYLGRIDTQVKIRGYRIELGEIRSVLGSLPGVGETAVVVREYEQGNKELVAYVVPETGAAGPSDGPADDRRIRPDALRESLAAVLPAYMVPSAYVVLPRLPLTASGKLDERALPAPDRHTDRSTRAFTAPRTRTEQLVAAVWQHVLHLEQVGAEDNFFDLGGDSIRAVALVGALRSEGFDVSVRDVFEFRSVARLAGVLEGRTTGLDEEPSVERFALLPPADAGSLPDGVEDAYPLSQVQAGMVFEMLSSTERTYHNVTSFRIRDDQPFSLEALRSAAAEVVARHEVLRTSIALAGHSEPLQLVHTTAAMTVGCEDLSALDAEAQDRAVRDHLDRERADLFDLREPPLLRLFAHVCGRTEWRIAVTECHAILEGWSYHSLLMELLGHYRRFRDGGTPEPYDPPAVRYADYVAAEQAALDSPDDAEHWRRTVTEGTKFELPAGWGDLDAPRQPYRIPVPFHDLEPRLRALASEAGVPFKSVLHAAHLKVLSMVSGEREFFTGLVCDTRPERLGADRVYGMYLNTVPFAFRLAAGTWRELVRDVFAQEVALWPHRRFPLSAMQARFAEGRRLVDVFFNYLDFHMVDLELVDYAMSVDDSPNEFPLSVATQLGHVVLTTDTSTLTRANGERLGAMYRAVLESMAEGPGEDARAALLPPGEYDRLIKDWNDTATPRRIACVHELFEERAAADPDAIAVTHGDTAWTYAELDARANRYAHVLRAHGVGPERLVGVLLDRGPELVAVLLGVWKAGGAYMPLDPTYPGDRLAYMLSDAGATVVVTENRYAQLLASVHPVRQLSTDSDRASVDAAPATRPEPAADVDQLAYIIYTSGSTGRPKGVLVPHRGLVNYLWWCVEGYAAEGSGGAPLFSSIAFDMVVPNLYTPLMMGERVHLLPENAGAGEIGKLLAEGAPYRFIKMTPGHLDLLAEHLTPEQAQSLAPLLAVGADAFPSRTLARWQEIGGSTRLLNEYGPTEISVANCTYPIEGVHNSELVPIGRPIPNTTMYVLDEDLRPAPVGVLGELYIGGAGVARGYANLPDKTAERFVPDPYGAPGARLYRTGDLCRVLDDGNVDFVDRADHQVKIRGYRVEPGEIQTVLTRHDGVRDALVVPHKLPGGDKQLIAYCVPDGDTLPDRGELSAHCRTELPDYMIPALFVALDRIPLNQNGKVNRRALPDPDLGSLAGEQPYTAPRTPLEEALCQVWSEVLGIEQIGVHHDFFRLGGYSLLLLRAVSRARSQGITVTTGDLLECRTVGELAARIEGALYAGEGTGRSLVWLSPDDGRDALFCVHPVGGSAHWYLPLAEHLAGRTQVAAFEAAAGDATVPELAARYTAELLRDRPNGPHRILAWSSGAAIACEMARHLVAEGHPAPVLTLIDPAAEGAGSLEDDYLARARQLLADRTPEAMAELGVLLHAAGIGTGSPEPGGISGETLTEDLAEALTERLAVWQAVHTATSAHHYAELPGPIALVVTDEAASGGHSVTSGLSYQDYLDQWRTLAPAGVHVDRIAGNHHAVLEAQHIDVLAALLVKGSR
ncbi:amino acid adenylation domain-containing protein [Streptomyces sp. NPDC051020]|uniref:amino acid adenylation domain-containing protein n=1 Tax=Streptomyces sp. NPDC051020 TaxID=3155409 RepID=UPI0034238BF8